MSVIRYQGKRGVVWRIKYRDASGRQVVETLGPEPAWNRRSAGRELTLRLADVAKGTGSGQTTSCTATAPRGGLRSVRSLPASAVMFRPGNPSMGEPSLDPGATSHATPRARSTGRRPTRARLGPGDRTILTRLREPGRGAD